MTFFEWVSRIVFAIVSCSLLLLACGLVLFATIQLFAAFIQPSPAVGESLLDAVGYTVIAVAVFEVSKYIFEEEVMHPTEMRHAGEARRSMTKFISTIAIAVFLEALVAIFQTSKEVPAIEKMLYPTLLLLAGAALIVGLGVYQRLSAATETIVRSSPETAAEEDAGMEKRR